MNQIRFLAFDGDRLMAQSDWFPESDRGDAPNALATFRRQHPGNFAYRVERVGDSKVPNPVKMYRFRIKVGDDVYYSKLFTEDEKDAGLAQIKEQFPEGEVTEGVT